MGYADYAITELETVAEIQEKNALIHEGEGNAEAASLSREKARSYRESIYVLKQGLSLGDMLNKMVSESAQ